MDDRLQRIKETCLKGDSTLLTSAADAVKIFGLPRPILDPHVDRSKAALSALQKIHLSLANCNAFLVKPRDFDDVCKFCLVPMCRLQLVRQGFENLSVSILSRSPGSQRDFL